MEWRSGLRGEGIGTCRVLSVGLRGWVVAGGRGEMWVGFLTWDAGNVVRGEKEELVAGIGF